MSDKFYPSVSLSFLETIRRLQLAIEQDAEYLSDEGCPYPEEIKAALKKAFPAVAPVVIRQASTVESNDVLTHLSPDAEDAKILALLADVEDLYSQLKDSAVKTSESASDQMGYFRTSTALLEKIANLTERASALRNYREFTNTVLEILEDVCTPEQRTVFITRLGDLAGGVK